MAGAGRSREMVTALRPPLNRAETDIDPTVMKQPLAIIIAGLLLAPATVLRGSQPEPGRPNILFIFSDDHSCQSIGAYRKWLSGFIRERQITPNIDRLADQELLNRAAEIIEVIDDFIFRQLAAMPTRVVPKSREARGGGGQVPLSC